MPNPFNSLGFVDVVGTIQNVLQRQATLRDTQLLGDEREQLIQQRKLENDQRQIAMRVLQQDLLGGVGAGMDKSNIPADSDTLIGSLQKQVREATQQAELSNRQALAIAEKGGSLSVAEQYRLNAREASTRANTAMRELRLAQHQQAQSLAEAAGTAKEDNFDTVMTKLREVDPKIDRKYPFDRDVNDQPVWGPKTERTLNTIGQASMTYKEQLDSKIKADKAIADAADQEDKRRLNKLREKDLDAKVAIDQVNAERARQGLGPLARERAPAASKDKVDKSVDRLQAMADKEPTKGAIESSQASIRSYAKEQGYEFDDTMPVFARAVAAKTNGLRAEAAKRGKDLSIEDARAEALDSMKSFVKKSDKEVPWYMPGKSEHKMTFSYPGPAGKAPATTEPANKVEGKDANVLIATTDRTVLKSGLQLQGRGTVEAPFVGVKTQAEFDQLPSGAIFVDPKDGKKYKKP